MRCIYSSEQVDKGGGDTSGWGLSGEQKFRVKIFFTDFCSGVCRNLSTDVFSEVALKHLQLKIKKRFQPASNHCLSPPCPPSNYTAALTRLTDDCSIRKSRGSPPKLQKFQRGLSPPIIYFTGAGAPPSPPPLVVNYKMLR